MQRPYPPPDAISCLNDDSAEAGLRKLTSGS